MSYISLDVGKKRIGVAIGSIIAQELTTLVLKEPAKSFVDCKEGSMQAILPIQKLINDNRVEKLIVGHPINDDGTDSEMSQAIEKFCQKIKENIDIPIIFVDETLTSFVAEEMLKEEGLSIKEAKLRVDQAAAKLILQQFIEEE